MEKTHRAYLDYAASTPLDPRVLEAMTPYFTDHFGNAGSLHSAGKAAKDAIERSRKEVALAVGAKPDEITFTSGGTEANNLAIFGTIAGREKRGTPRETMHVITSAIEHSSVGDCFSELQRQGVSVSYAEVSEHGLVDVPKLKALLRPETVLVSVVLVSNEIGTIQPIKEIAHILREHERAHQSRVYLHTDASQGVVYTPVTFQLLDADLITIDAQKLYGPKGAGALAHKLEVPLSPILFGGTQERGLRPGTPVTPLVVGFAEAVAIAERKRHERTLRVRGLRDQLIEGIEAVAPFAVLNGDRNLRIANNANFSFVGYQAELLALALDEKGVACSTRSACLGGTKPGSKIIRALGGGEERAVSALRFTLGASTTADEIAYALAALGEVLTTTPQ